jgi:hypothetical protein
MVAGLVPGVWEQDEDPAEAGGRQAGDQRARIVGQNADAGPWRTRQPGQEMGDPVQEWLAAD